MVTASNVTRGQVILYQEAPCLVMETMHRTPGNLRGFVQMTLRNLKTGRSLSVRFASTDKLEVVPLRRRKYEFSYRDGTTYHFIDPETFDTVELPESMVTHAKDYLSENQPVDLVFMEETVVALELPPSVALRVTEAPEWVRGDSATNVMKPATVETGLVVQVPLFIKEGERIRVSTEDGRYLGRA
ncbi:Elongation factor P [Candidatus Methylacidithermus pantelleriae]|uniref:Elongation factor P n=1 Tax=Candidatus Methylacidithermus pantelleriae TaxID=2744239 RepID=A0A8J2BPX5_9BACT|nr:Elongation factor P [Candidatus Methylacidithermus pantelleriae]